MEKLDTYIDVLMNANYCEHPSYNGRELFPNTGNVTLDFDLFNYALTMTLAMGDGSIETYFYCLDTSMFLAYITGKLNNVSKEESIYQYVINKTDNFKLFGNMGSIVPGYTLIIPDQHVLSMSALSEEYRREYINFLYMVREQYKMMYGRNPIIFEHGSNVDAVLKSNSVDHAHTHIVNHRYENELEVINYLNMKEVSSVEEMLVLGEYTNYISYISPDGKCYFTDNHLGESQIMRKFIANDVGREKEWDWRLYPHTGNSFETAKRFLLAKNINVRK